MSESAIHLLQHLHRRLRRLRWRVTFATWIQRLAQVVAVLGLCLILISGVEALFWLSSWYRGLLLGLFLLVLAGGIGYALLLPAARHLGWVRGLDDETLARWVGHRIDGVRDRLLTLLQLEQATDEGSSPALRTHAIEHLGSSLREVPIEQTVSLPLAFRPWLYLGLPVLLLTLLLFGSVDGLSSALIRVFHPRTPFERPLPFQFRVTPGDVRLVQGDVLRIQVDVQGKAPSEPVELIMEWEGERPQTVAMALAPGTGAFVYTQVNVRKPLRYRVQLAGVASPWYYVTVLHRPVIRGLQVRLVYPAYTGLSPRVLEPNVGDFSALRGTRVDISIRVEAPVATAFIRFESGREVAMKQKGDYLQGTFVVQRSDVYYLEVRNTDGIANADPVHYTIQMLPDRPPEIVLIHPAPEYDLTAELRVPIGYRMADDFGFSRLRLYYRLSESRFGTPDSAFRYMELVLPEYVGGTSLEGSYLWDLAAQVDLDPVPGDVISYYLKVWDNDRVSGYKSAQSAVWRLRFPSLAEQYEALDAGQDDVQEKLEELLEEAGSIRREFDQVHQELLQKQEADWEDKRQVQELREREEALQERLDQVMEQFEEITREMEENDLVSEETLQLYEELKRAFEEIKTPELMKALQELQKAMEELNLQQIQQSLEDFQFNETQYRQRLERTLELFKRLRVQQEMEEIARRMEALARSQEELKKATEELQGKKEEGMSSPEQQEQAEQLAREQERNAAEMERIEQEMDSLRQQMQELRRMPEREFKDLQREVRDRRLPEQMRENSEDLRRQELDKARKGQEQLEEQLRKLSQRMQQMQQRMQGQQLNINVAALRRVLYDVLTLSMDQEALRRQLDRQAPDSPLLRDVARREMELSTSVAVVSDSLQQLAREIPQMTREVQQKSGEALREMQQAVEVLSERMLPQASGHQKAAMTHLNELALLLSDLLDQLQQQQGQGGGGMSMQQFIQQLQQISRQQQQLNKELQQLLNDMQGNRLSESARERMERIARQQEALRRQLEELARNRELSRKILGDLEEIGRQMEKTVEELRQRRMHPELIERQQQILTRLLQAQRSLRERGKERKRERQVGKDRVREGPPELQMDPQLQQLRQELLKALEAGYSPDYQRLIKQYFERLLQQQVREQKQP